MREAFNAGKIETTAVINIEQVAINIIELVLISDGILLRKYISSGKRLILKGFFDLWENFLLKLAQDLMK